MLSEYKKNMDTEWLFSPGYRLCDEDINYLNDRVEWYSIDVPYCWNGSKWMTVLGDYYYKNGYYKDHKIPPFKDHSGIGWYKRDFSIPSEWKNKRIHIHFGGVSAKAKVWVNGNLVGEHLGAYSSFEWDITDMVNKDGSMNRIIVKVWDKSCFYPSDDPSFNIPKINTRVPGRRTVTPVGETKNNGGIDRSVTLYATPQTYVESVDVETSSTGYNAKVRIVREELFGNLYKVKLRIVDLMTQEVCHEVMKESQLPDEFMTLTFKGEDIGVEPWWPHAPKLYKLEIEIQKKDEKPEYFNKIIGFKTFEIEESKFFLNGHPYFLRGAGTPPHPIILNDREYIQRFLAYCKTYNLNCIRFHTEPPSQAWLDGCDQFGLLAIYEMPLMQQAPEAIQTRREFKKMVSEVKHHPSLAFYCICNENDHFTNITDPIGYKDIHVYLNDLHEAIREADGTLPICNNSGFKDIRTTGDIKDIHSYNGWYNAATICFEEGFRKEECKDEHANPLYFSTWKQRIEEGRHKPLILTEFIAAYTDDDGRFYQVPCARRFIGKDPDPGNERAMWYQAHLIEESIEIFRRERNEYTNISGVAPFAIFNWFFHPLSKERMAPKPAAKILKKTMEPTHVSIRCRQKRRYSGQTLGLEAYLIHDDVSIGDIDKSCVSLKLLDKQDPTKVILEELVDVGKVDYYTNKIIPFSFQVPEIENKRAEYKIVIEWMSGTGESYSINEVEVTIFAPQIKGSTSVLGQAYIYDPNESLTAVIRGLKNENNLSIELVHSFEQLTHGDRLIIGCDMLDMINKNVRQQLKDALKRGVHILLMEQRLHKMNKETLAIDWVESTTLNLVREGRGIDDFVDVRTDSDIFTDLEKQDFREWNGDTIIIGSYIQQGDESRQIPAKTKFGSRFGFKVRKYDHVTAHIECSNFSRNDALIEMVAEKGSFMWSQVEAVRRYGEDPIATKYIHNLVNHFMNKSVEKDGGVENV